MSVQFYIISLLRTSWEKIDGKEEKIPILSCQGTNLSDLVFGLTTSDLLSKKISGMLGSLQMLLVLEVLS